MGSPSADWSGVLGELAIQDTFVKERLQQLSSGSNGRHGRGAVHFSGGGTWCGTMVSAHCSPIFSPFSPHHVLLGDAIAQGVRGNAARRASDSATPGRHRFRFAAKKVE